MNWYYESEGLLFIEFVCSCSVFDLANNKLWVNPLTLVIVPEKFLKSYFDRAIDLNKATKPRK